MGKSKAMLEEDMMLHPELYNGHADEEFWMESIKGKCVECFKPLPEKEIICAKCQDELDGRWDHLREK